MKILGISIWRILVYFIIYSFIGYFIEMMYAGILYGIVESRQSFLYGPFCAIYGMGAVLMICSLHRLNKNVHTLFLGGFLVRKYNGIYGKLYRRKSVQHQLVGLFRKFFEFKWQNFTYIFHILGSACSISNKNCESKSR